jgi:hypothetical protein
MSSQKMPDRDYVADARALIEMGARVVDVKTVSGLLEVIDSIPTVPRAVADRALGATRLKWTHKTPSVPGRYWIRHSAAKAFTCLVEENDMAFGWPADYEWAGPIQEPE